MKTLKILSSVLFLSLLWIPLVGQERPPIISGRKSTFGDFQHTVLRG